MKTKIIKSIIKKEFSCKLEEIWQIITDNTNYAWRSDLEKIKIVDDNNFIEYAKNGYPTYFEIIAKDPLKEYQFNIKNSNLVGKWTGKFYTTSENKVLLDFTEEIEVKSLPMKLLAKQFLKSQQKRYMKDLENIINNKHNML